MARYGTAVGQTHGARRRAWRVALFVIAAASTAAPGVAAAAPQHNPKGRFLGVVKSARASERPTPQAQAQAQLAAGNLTYHGGAVMHSNRTHAIYWEPSGFSTTATYKSLINGYLGDVAADSAKHSNVYASDVQYTDGSGNAAYSSSSGGAVVATDPYPASGCTDPGTTVCLTDTQIQAEVNKVVTDNGLPRGLGDLYVVMTPQGVGSCFDSGSTSCAYTDYCAYHSNFGTGLGETLYSNQPDAGTPSCDSGQHPNGDVADSTINLISHEHNEAITDPDGFGWWDSAGNENGDKCAWNFGSALGSTSNGQYNQLIHTRDYYLQQEWSNASHGCVLTMPNTAPTASFTSAPASPTAGQAVSFDGTASSDSDGTISSYSWDFGDGATGSGATPSHTYATAGTYAVKLTVTDNDDAQRSVTHSVVVAAHPLVAAFPLNPPNPAVGQAVAFDASGSSDTDGTVTGYSWDFGDGAIDTTTGATPSHSYATSGTKVVTLTVTDDHGRSDTITHDVAVTESTGSAPPGGGGTTTGGGQAPAAGSQVSGLPPTSSFVALPPAGARLVIPTQRLSLSAARATRVLVRCGAGRRCAGTLTLSVTVPATGRGGNRTRTLVLGRTRFSVAALHAVTVPFRLRRVVATLLKAHRRIRVRATAVVANAVTGSASVARFVWLAPAAKPRR
jgi:PKD repeat protein